MSKNPTPAFVYLSVDAFRALTQFEKQQYLEALKQHLEDPIRPVREDQSPLEQ